MTLAPLVLAALLSANASGKTLVRQQQGTIVPAAEATDRPLISTMNCDLTHLRWNGSALVDIRANGWAMTGTVPQNPKVRPIPASAGAFSDANYYSLGSGSDALDVGTLSVCVVFTLDSLPGVGARLLVSDGLSGTDGWLLDISDTLSNIVYFNANAAATTGRAQTANTVVTGLNVACGGFDPAVASGTSYVKLNLGTYATKNKASAMTPATTRAAYVGRYFSAGFALTQGKIHEVCATSAAPSDAEWIAAMNEIKTKTGTVAW